MLIRSGIPVTPEQKQIDHIMTELEMCNDLSNTDKSVLAEYIEGLEEELRMCIVIANKHGWDGICNSKFLPQFFDEELDRIQELRPADEWRFEDGDVLWWHWPLCEAPIVGGGACMGQLDVDGEPTDCRVLQEKGWLTHWSPLPQVKLREDT